MSLPRRTAHRLAPAAMLRGLLARRGLVAAPLGREWAASLDAIRDTRARVPLLMNDAAALQIQVAVRAARRLGGAMAEAGVLMGGSARLICEAKGAAPLHLFDVFEGLQRSAGAVGAAADIAAHFGPTHGVAAEVARLLADYPEVHLHPGVFPQSAAALAGARFAFAHIDLDLPQGIRAALDFFHPRLLPGGILIADDYQDADVRCTVDAFFDGRDDTVFALPWGQAMIVRQGGSVSR